MTNNSTVLLKIVFPVALWCLSINPAKAQLNEIKIDSVTESRISALEKQAVLNKPGYSRMVIVGLTTFGYVSNRTVTTTAGITQTDKSSVMGGGATYELSPMFLWRQGKKVLIEFEPSFNNDGLSVNWANISYFAVPNVIVHGGYFVLPFGMYSKKLAAGWINKVATDPIGMPAGADYGVGLSGGLPLGSIKWNYDLSVTNGFALLANGQIQKINLSANSRGKTFTGRIGLLPISDNSLEIGISGMTGGLANGNPQFQNARTNQYALDLNYVKNISLIQINVKSQYNVMNVSNQNYVNPEDSTEQYTFSNHSTSGYGQFSLRPIGFQNKFVKNIEFAIRYGNYITPSNSIWGNKATQIDYGMNYWINWRTVLRVTYEIINSVNTSNKEFVSGPDKIKMYGLHMQFSIQL
jgi:hypothetical protein